MLTKLDIQNRVSDAKDLGWTIHTPTASITRYNCSVDAMHSCGAKFTRGFSYFCTPSPFSGNPRCYTCYPGNKTGPKTLTGKDRAAKFNALNTDRKLRFKEGLGYGMKHLACGTVYEVSREAVVLKNVLEDAATRADQPLASRYRGLGCPHCETDHASSYESRKATNIRRYGVEMPAQAKAQKAKTARTNMKRLGVKSPLASPELRAQVYRRLEIKYGMPKGSVNNPMDVAEIKAKITDWRKDYDKVDDAAEARRATCLRKYGVEYSTQTERMKRNSRKTSIRRFGVRHYAQSHEARQNISRFYLKSYDTDSEGNQIIVQGYESLVLDKLKALKSCALVTGSSDRISYVDGTGKARKYFPDLKFISTSGKEFMVEVKSSYTLTNGWETNMCKFRAARRLCRSRGITFVVLLVLPEVKKNVEKEFRVVPDPTRKRLLRALERLD